MFTVTYKPERQLAVLLPVYVHLLCRLPQNPGPKSVNLNRSLVSWISSMTRHLYWKDYAPADYVTAASSYLTGIALRNWESAYIILDRAGKNPEEYQTFLAQMRFDYGQTHREGRIREELLVSSLSQTGSLENNCTTFRNKVRELYCKPLSAETEVLLFRKGLKSKNLRDRCDYMPGTQDDFNNLKSIQDHVLKIAGSDGRGEKEREEGGAGPEPKSKGHGHENAKPPSSGMQSQKSQKNSKNKPDAAQATGRLDQDSREYKYALEKGVCLYCAQEGHMSGCCPKKANGKPRVSIRVPHNWEPKDRRQVLNSLLAAANSFRQFCFSSIPRDLPSEMAGALDVPRLSHAEWIDLQNLTGKKVSADMPPIAQIGLLYLKTCNTMLIFGFTAMMLITLPGS